jgi:hypothetical protein
MSGLIPNVEALMTGDVAAVLQVTGLPGGHEKHDEKRYG